jgi:signal peptidase I
MSPARLRHRDERSAPAARRLTPAATINSAQLLSEEHCVANQTRNGEAGQAGDHDPPGDSAADQAAGDSAAAGDDAADQAAAGGEVGAGDAVEDATESGAEGGKRRRSGWREVPVLIVVALAVALLVKAFVVQAFFIPSSSMEDTLLIGDKILVNKLTYHFRSIQRGDIIVFSGAGSWDSSPPPAQHSSDPVVRGYDVTLRPLFHSIADLFGTPVGQTDYVKRVIGVPGDHVACCNAQGLVTVNGVPLQERSYVYPGAAPSTVRFSVTVPPGRLWVQGDYRTVSFDSRLRQGRPGHGTIPENKVTGRAFVIVWPPSRWRILPIPSTFGQPALSKAAASGSSAAAALPPGITVSAEPSGLPLAAGLACAVPLTWLQRRTRRRLRGRLRARREPPAIARRPLE